MASIITELLDRREIEKYLSGVAGVGKNWVLNEIPTDAEGWIGTGDDGIVIDELGSERCLIKYELWDGPPPVLDTWDRTWSGSVRLTSGKINSVEQYSGDVSCNEEFDLGRENSVWQVRIHRKSLGHEEFTTDIVSFTLLKLQFWLDH
ncbi:hypothetical protein SAMN05216275_1684 [Streptosporangium canum]|uniref:Uncharacterized protein n=1 Tax=Streptosporangium canum TaxID=324952 RepID=A0A1I4FR51_9ACTN|nr:hypothetical protein [Streptosporangium canum]SFL19306.1 hypothetical protein SAMN05216275_1684 [Streptosporangium canum]